MTLPGHTINTIKTRLSNTVSAKDPRGIASAVELPPLPKRIIDTTGSGGSESQQHHVENFRIDGADWSNVLNPLLDAHLAIQSVRPPPVDSRKKVARERYFRRRTEAVSIKRVVSGFDVSTPVCFNCCYIMRGDVSPSSVWTSTRAPFPVAYRTPDADGNPVLQHYFLFLGLLMDVLV